MLLIGASVRLLAQSGHRAGLTQLAVDRFMDEDTLEAVAAGFRLRSEEALEPSAIIQAVDALDPDERAALVYTGGLENHPALLETLCRHRPLKGNSPTLLRTLRDAALFFNLLDTLSIPYPSTRREPPDSPENWLLKSACSEGGKGVRFAAQTVPCAGDYYQQRIEGPACSVLFLANGSDVRRIGFNTLWSLSAPQRPFLFAGAANFTVCAKATLSEVSTWLPRLVRRTGLVGLNSLDFVVNEDGRPLALEINPRPSATLGLYDAEIPGGLLKRHLDAVEGHALEEVPLSPCRAFHVMLSPASLRLSARPQWPEWCHDRPNPEAQIARGAPFCTVEATGQTASDTLRRLKQRQTILDVRLKSALTRSVH